MLNSSWITLMLSSIVRGNNANDRVTLGIGSPFFSVADAKANLVSVLGNLTLEDTIDLSITTTDPQIPQSSLDFYQQRLEREPNLATLIIANGKTICFVGYNNKTYVLDSHRLESLRTSVWSDAWFHCQVWSGGIPREYQAEGISKSNVNTENGDAWICVNERLSCTIAANFLEILASVHTWRFNISCFEVLDANKVRF